MQILCPCGSYWCAWMHPVDMTHPQGLAHSMRFWCVFRPCEIVLFVLLSIIPEVYNFTCHFIFWSLSQSESCWWVSHICPWNNSKLVWQCTCSQICLLTCGLPKWFLLFLDVGRSFLKSWLRHLGIVTQEYIGIMARSFFILKFLSEGGNMWQWPAFVWPLHVLGHTNLISRLSEKSCNIRKMFSCGRIELFWHFWKNWNQLKQLQSIMGYIFSSYMNYPALRWPGLMCHKCFWLIPDQEYTQNRPSLKFRTVDAWWIITIWVDRNPWKYDMPFWTWMSSLLPLSCVLCCHNW